MIDEHLKELRKLIKQAYAECHLTLNDTTIELSEKEPVLDIIESLKLAIERVEVALEGDGKVDGHGYPDARREEI